MFLTSHARERLRERGIEQEEIATVLCSPNRLTTDNGDGTLTHKMGTLKVICNARDGAVVTAFRKSNVKKKLKKRRQMQARQRRATKRQEYIEEAP